MFKSRVAGRWTLFLALITVVAVEAESQPELRAYPLAYGMFGGFRAFPDSIAEGGIVSFMNFNVVNSGSEDAAAFQVSIYVSDDETIDTSDTRLWNTSIPSLSAEGSMQLAVGAVTLPSALVARTYWYGVIVDDANAVTESDEANNVMEGASRLTVLAPVNADLQFDFSTTYGASYAPFVVGAGDTYGTDFGMTGSPVLVAPDGNLVFMYKVKNTGSEASPDFRAEYYLSNDSNVTSTDNYLGADHVAGVAAGGWRTAGFSKHRLPESLQPGTYYAGVILDSESQIIETAGANAESNNVFVRQVTVLDIASDDTPIWRVQLRLRTGNIDKARTNDSVYVKLGDQTMWLDYARNDFERSDDFTYDILLEDVRKFGDLSSLTIGKYGTNGWCLDQVELKVNGATYFTHDFPGSCTWLDNPHLSTFFGYSRQPPP